MSRLSKQQLAGKLAKKTLTSDEKIKFLDFAKKICKTCMCLLNYQIFTRLERQLQQIILRMKRTFANNVKCFPKIQGNVTAMATTTK